ncbi:MAG: response regulator [Bacteroidetes bacterium]|nr:response regulator [Bacteroidota bacterium]
MASELRILHLEDDVKDAELIHTLLRRAGFFCSFRRVDTEDNFKRALAEETYDMIISDFSLPTYNGKAALEYAHKWYSDTPFIIVSGTVGEDYAIESLLNGATDYVSKAKMSRLVPAITRTVKEKEEKSRRREAEKALVQRDRRFRALIENSLEGIGIYGENGEVLYRSPVNAHILGLKEYRPEGGNLYDDIHSDDVLRVKADIARIAQVDRAKVTVIFRNRHGDGSWRWLEATFSNLKSEPTIGGIISNFRDITERREAEIALRQAQKMESLGTLAGGIAHDFNNILGIVMGYSSLLMERELDTEKFSQCVRAIQSAAERGVGLVRQLLMFARKEESEFLPLNLNDVVKEVFGLISQTFPKVISMILEADPDIPLVIGDSIQINQCILNLCVNARDAMMDRADGKPAGGILKIATSLADTEAVSRFVSDSHGKTYVAITVSDTGTGMDKGTRARVFEPFFTTKEKGKGTGIGLATVFGVMKKHGGFIDLDSVVGAGTTFVIYFPTKPNDNFETHSDVRRVSDSNRGEETILIAEDEETLKELLKDALIDKGYRVLTAKNGREALSVLSENGDVALVLSDLGLPELDGIEVLRIIKESNSGVKVILASGFMQPEETHRMERLHVDGFIQKPYRLNEVTKKIREILDRD